MSGERQIETHQTERTTDGMGHVWTEESDLDRLDELEAEVARVRAENDRLKTWQKAYAKGRAGLVEQADQDFARAEAAEARVAELEAERDSYKRLVLGLSRDEARWLRKVVSHIGRRYDDHEARVLHDRLDRLINPQDYEAE